MSDHLELPIGLRHCQAEVVFLTRVGCCLCVDAKNEMQKLQREIPFEFQEFDIDKDSSLREQYNDEVPVIFIHGKKAFKYKIDAKQFLRRLVAGRRK